MSAYFANLDLFDPTGPERMTDGNVYGGETRLFVLTAPSLDAALRKLAEAITDESTRIDRVHRAAPVAEFATEDFPFEVNLDAMVRDAVEQGEICVTPDYTFSPYGNNETGVFYGMFELYDPSREGPYAGEFTYAAMRAENCGTALTAILDDIARNNCRLKSVDDFSDAGFYNPAAPLQSGSLGDLIRSELEGIVWADGTSIYSHEED